MEQLRKDQVKVKPEETKLEFIDDVIEQLEKKFGPGSATTLESDKIFSHVPGYISTQCTALDWAIGREGVPLGRLTEISGTEATSKTALGIHILAECQKQGGVAILIDSENAFDPSWARKLGLDTKHLVCMQPETIEDVFDEEAHVISVVKKRKSNVPVVILHDSLAASPTRAEVAGEFGDSFPATHARVISAAIRKILSTITREKIALVIINQLKEKIGVVFGDKFVSFGGRALKYHASLRIQVTRTGYLKKGIDTVGIPVRARVIKNKIAVPFKEANYDFYFEKGIDNVSALLDLAERLERVKKNGALYEVGSERFRKKDAAKSAFIKTFEKEIRDELKSKTV